MSFKTIGKLAKACDVTTDTVRYYETQGILEASNRTDSGYRLYSEDAIARLRFIKRAQGLGLTLKEIKEMLALGSLPTTDCEDVRQKVLQKIEEIESRIRDLTDMKLSLENLAENCPGEGRPLEECTILQYLYSPQRS